MLRCATRVHVVSRCARGIDARGLHKTNLAALRDGLRGVTEGLRGEVLCLVDGFSVADFGRPQRAIVEGDATSAAIAAASISRQGDPRPLHAPCRHRAPRLALRGAHGLLHAISSRGDPAPGGLTAAPHVVSVAGLPAARAVAAASITARPLTTPLRDARGRPARLSRPPARQSRRNGFPPPSVARRRGR